MNKQKAIECLDMIEKDIENDVKELEGKDFNGRNVADYLGKLAATVNAIGIILKEYLKNDQDN